MEFTKEELAEKLRLHKQWLDGEGGVRLDLCGVDLCGANMSGADLRRADLTCANLSGVDLQRAELDYSCLPLWCRSLTAHFDDRQLIQIAYHLVKAGLHSKNASDATKKELAKLIDFANQFHRVEECGWIEWEGNDGTPET